MASLESALEPLTPTTSAESILATAFSPRDSLGSAPVKHGVLISPLYTDTNAHEMAAEILKLMATVDVHGTDICRLAICSRAGYAKIEVYEKECEDHIVWSFAEAIEGGLYNPAHLLEEPQLFNVVRIEMLCDQEGCYQERYLDISDYSDSEEEDFECDENSDNESPTKFGRSNRPDGRKTCSGTASINSRQRGSAETETNVIEIEDKNKQHQTSMSGEGAVDLHVDTSGKVEPRSPGPRNLLAWSRLYPETVFYMELQKIVPETKNFKFINGSVAFSEPAFKRCVGECVAELVSSQGGTIYVGVSESGIAGGIIMDSLMEKDLGWDTEFAVDFVSPHVAASEYSFTLAGLIDEHGELSPKVKVFVIRVKPSRRPAVPHHYDCVFGKRRLPKNQKTYNLDFVKNTEL